MGRLLNSGPARSAAGFIAALATGLGGAAIVGPAEAASGGSDRLARAATTARVGPPATQAKKRDLRRVVYVGNNWDGTASVLRPDTFKQVAKINIIPDYQQRMQEIVTNPYRLAYFLAIRALIGEGNDQYVDDMYSSVDGRLLVVSRPSFADVVAINLRTKRIKWRFPVAGVRSDHMALSPNGRRVIVSASTGNVVHVLRVRDGKQVGKFKSGGSPHESTYIDGGKRILHASIGTVYSPFDNPDIPDPLEDQRVLQIVNAKTNKIVRRYNLRKALNARGMKKVSIAVRPMTLSPDEKKIYFQLSFFHGFVEMSRKTGKITRVKRLPNLIKSTPRVLYLLDSAHHGIAMNPKGTKICVAGTMSDYATVVNAKTFKHSRLLKRGLKPYWVTPSWDGRYCYISWSGSDKVSRISYRTGRVVTTTKVGDHPQRVRNGFIRKDFLRKLGKRAASKPARTSGPTLWEIPTNSW